MFLDCGLHFLPGYHLTVVLKFLEYTLILWIMALSLHFEEQKLWVESLYIFDLSPTQLLPYKLLDHSSSRFSALWAQVIVLVKCPILV